MIQDILTFTIIAFAAGYTLYHLYLIVFRGNKKAAVGCAGCSGCEMHHKIKKARV